MNKQPVKGSLLPIRELSTCNWQADADYLRRLSRLKLKRKPANGREFANLHILVNWQLATGIQMSIPFERGLEQNS